MPWTMEDYPQSWKNMDKLERKKAIDIGNAMLKDGYEESNVIPIATKQAESWYKDASEKELESLKNKKITKHEKDDSAVRIQHEITFLFKWAPYHLIRRLTYTYCKVFVIFFILYMILACNLDIILL